MVSSLPPLYPWRLRGFCWKGFFFFFRLPGKTDNTSWSSPAVTEASVSFQDSPHRTDSGQLISSFQGNLPEPAARELAPDNSSEPEASVANWKDEQGYQEVGWGSSLPGLMNINGYQSQAQKSADSLRQKVMLMRNSQRSLEPQLGMNERAPCSITKRTVFPTWSRESSRRK